MLKVPAINPQTLVPSRQAHFIREKDASSVPYSKRTAGVSSTWQRRYQCLRNSSAGAALIHYLSGETGPVGDIQGLSWVPSSCLQRSVFGGLNWKQENDVQGMYSVVKHNDPVIPSSPQPFPPKLLCCLCVLSLFLSQCAYSSLVVFSQILYARGHFSWLKVCFFCIEGNIKQNKQPQENISKYFIIMHLG